MLQNSNLNFEINSLDSEINSLDSEINSLDSEIIQSIQIERQKY